MVELRVLVVCTGNVCRSPAAERLLGTWLGPAGVCVASAGTSALTGEPMTEQMARLVEGAGGVTAGFRSRQLTEEMVIGTDLVLGMTGEHCSTIVTLHPPAVEKTFSLCEFVRLGRNVALGDLPAGPAVERLAALIPAALAARAAARGTPEGDDIEDPYRRGDEEYRRAFGRLRSAVHGVVELAVG